MKLVRGTKAWQACTGRGEAPGSGTAVTIGNFDGAHVGHAHIFAQLRAAARQHELASVVLSFEPLPQQHFWRENAPLRLQGLRNRVESISASGIDYLMLLAFNDALAQLTPEQFIQQILIETLQVKHLIVGDDFRFGRDRAGNVDTLRAAGRAAEQADHFTVVDTTTVDIDGARVSSTRVRQALANNEIEEVATLLGRPYRIDGRVIHGEKLGRQLGFPTANVALKKLVPPLAGVFAVFATDLDTGKRYPAVANLGHRPTIGGRRLLLEVHLLNENRELYGHHLAIDFMHFIRGERRFDSLDELKAQIASDSTAARTLLT
jgi:riboflavin kinase/FMN adenylyltransferase